MGTPLLLPKSLACSTKTPFQDSTLYCVVPAATGKCGSAGAGPSDPQAPSREAVRVLALQVRKLAASPNSLLTLCHQHCQQAIIRPTKHLS